MKTMVMLLEGSEKLFHWVPIISMGDLYNSGKFIFSQLVGHYEEESAIKRAYGKVSKLYYFSFARSLGSEYFANVDATTKCIFEFSGRKVSRYGRVVPINFFSYATFDMDDEMEDRLITDKSHMDIGVCDCMHVVCTDGYLDEIEQFRSRYGIEIRYYRNYADLRVQRRSMGYEERSGMRKSEGATKFHTSFNGQARTYNVLRDGIFSFLTDRNLDFDVGEFKRFIGLYGITSRSLWAIRIHNVVAGHELVKLLRSKGYGSADGLKRLNDEIADWIGLD